MALQDIPATLKPILPTKPLLLFDGLCNLCNSSIQFHIRHDVESKLMFASLQSDIGQKILKNLGLDTETLSSMIFIDKEHYFLRSDAALESSKYLDGNWRWLHSLKIFPKFLRDFVYGIIAKNRYKWFGKQSECWLPTPELKRRFLE